MKALEPLMFTGLGVVAIWVYVRLPARRPASIARAMARVVLSWTLFFMLPIALDVFAAIVHGRGAAAAFVVCGLMPSLAFLLLSWVWLLGRIVEDVGPRLPRGGHRAPGTA